MIIGDCPYDDCDHASARPMPPASVPLPAYAKDTCEGCGRPVWVKYSHIDPVAYTPADFEAEHIIDHEKREVRERAETRSEPQEVGS